MPECSFTDQDALWFHLYAHGKSNVWVRAKIEDLKAIRKELLPKAQPQSLQDLDCAISLLETGLKKRLANTTFLTTTTFLLE